MTWGRIKSGKKVKWKVVLSGDLPSQAISPSLPLCLCIPLLTGFSFSSRLFDKLPVLMPSVQCPLSTPINSYIYQSFLLTKKEASIIKVIKNDL